MTDTRRYFYLDLLRAAAISLVVLIHVVSNLVYKYNSLPPSWWWIANMLDGLARPGVPLFVMISGALLLDPRRAEPPGDFLARRLRKVLLPFLVWSAVYLGWRVWYHGESLSLGGMLTALAEGSTYGHLWFVYMLLGLYLAAPILRAFARAADRRLLGYFLLLSLAAACVAPLLNRALGIEIGLQFAAVGGYAGYFVLGHYLQRYPVRLKRSWPWIALYAAAALFTVLGSGWLTVRQGGSFSDLFYDYLSPGVVVMSACLFAWARAANLERLEGSRLARQGVLLLSSTSFSIYLMHVIVLEVFKGGIFGLHLSATSVHPLVGIPLTLAVTLGLCAGTARLAQRVPLLREIFP